MAKARKRKPPIDKVGTRRLVSSLKIDIRKLLKRKA